MEERLKHIIMGQRGRVLALCAVDRNLIPEIPCPASTFKNDSLSVEQKKLLNTTGM